jgi:hypothetical protein
MIALLYGLKTAEACQWKLLDLEEKSPLFGIWLERLLVGVSVRRRRHTPDPNVREGMHDHI